MSLDNKKRILFLIFVLSGVGGLIYESIWSHYLKLFLGHAAYAQSLVLAIFMGGMGLGAWLAGRYSSRLKNLLLGYAAVEMIIGVCALVFHIVFVGFTDYSYANILPALSSPAIAELFRWSGSALLILPQSILLGMTFPLLSGGLIRLFPNTSGQVLSTLYFTNSLGAAIGVLLSGFILIEAVGLPGTILTAGIINILVALAVWAVGKGLPVGAALESQSAAVIGPDAVRERRQLLLVALLTGCASFIYEIIWIRMLSMVLGSSNHAFEIMLSAFILGLALGSLFIKRFIHRLENPRFTLAMIQIVMGLLAVGSLVLYNASFDAMRVVMQTLAKTDQGYAAFNLASLAITIVIMLPAAFCAGMTLPLITHVLIRNGHGERSIGNVYAANTFGSIAGVVLAVHIGLPMLGIKGALMMGAAIDIAAGVYLLWGSRGLYPARFGPNAMIAASLACFALIFAFVHPDELKMASGIYRYGTFVSPATATVVLHKDGKTATVDVLSEHGILTLRTNGKTDASLQTGEGKPTSDEYTQTLIGVLGLYHRPQTEYVATIGIGSGMTTHAVLASPRVKEVHTIEIERFMVDGAREFGTAVERTLNDPRSKIFIDDAKSFLAVNPRQYDMIISEPSNPWVSGVSSLFTREFYGRMKSKLKADGLFLQWLQVYQLDFDLVATVVKGLGAEFNDYVVYETNRGDLVIIASPTQVADPSDDLFTHPNVVTMLKRFNVLAPGDLEMRRLGNKRLLQPYFDSFRGPLNSDYFPILDLRATRDRFLGKSAMSLTELHTYAIPVTDILQARTPGPSTLKNQVADSMLSPRLADAVIARQMADFVRDGDLQGKPSLNGNFGLEIEHVRNHWINCNSANAGMARLDPMLRFAQFANPALSPAELSGMWNTFVQSRCYAALSPTHQSWIRLFAAVGERNAEAMVAAVRAMPRDSVLKSEANPDYLAEVEYRQIALITGLLATGKRAEAKQEWAEVLKAKSDRFRRTPMAYLLDAQLNAAP